jgi:hypothetical protein
MRKYPCRYLNESAIVKSKTENSFFDNSGINRPVDSFKGFQVSLFLYSQAQSRIIVYGGNAILTVSISKGRIVGGLTGAVSKIIGIHLQ